MEMFYIGVNVPVIDFSSAKFEEFGLVNTPLQMVSILTYPKYTTEFWSGSHDF